jgi:LPS-assembly protein
MLLALVGAPFAVRAADPPPCPSVAADNRSTATTTTAPPPVRQPAVPKLEDEDVDLSSEKAEVGVDGTAILKGNVVVKQGEREIRAENVDYNQNENSFKVEGGVDYDDPLVHVTGGGGSYSATEGAEFRDAEFELHERSARGAAGLMQLTPEGLINLNGVRFTTCPVDDTSWQLRADQITLDTRTRIGTGRGTRVDFKGVPIMYLPWMSFPLGSERKSGFLFPTPGHSSRSGLSVTVPYYWNIAPNADLTFEPTE